jgi:hypothetical protein
LKKKDFQEELFSINSIEVLNVRDFLMVKMPLMIEMLMNTIVNLNFEEYFQFQKKSLSIMEIMDYDQDLNILMLEYR